MMHLVAGLGRHEGQIVEAKQVVLVMSAAGDGIAHRLRPATKLWHWGNRMVASIHRLVLLSGSACRARSLAMAMAANARSSIQRGAPFPAISQLSPVSG